MSLYQTSSTDMCAEHLDIISRTLNSNNELEIVVRIKSNIILTSNPPQKAPDIVKKEIYGIEGDRIVLKKVIEGTHIPSKYIPEQIKFND